MMPYRFAASDGSMKELDLDAVFDVALGYSGRRPEWTATIIYDPSSKAFVELRSGPEDYRGNSPEEAEQVSEQYLFNFFQLGHDQLQSIRKSPGKWKLINLR